MRYAEYLPSPRLAAIVERLWILEGPGAGIADAILPDGRIEIIFHCGAPFRQHLPSGAVVIQPSAVLAGQILSPISLSHVGAARVVAIRLRPWSARALVREHADAFTERVVGLDDCLPGVAAALERLREAPDDRECVRIVEDWLLEIGSDPPDREMSRAVRALEVNGSRTSVDEIARETGLGRRQFERRFRASVGLSPRTFARIARLQQALGAVRAGQSLADAAAACGYCDQAHMARDFRLLAGAAPSTWQRHAGALAPLFLGGAD